MSIKKYLPRSLRWKLMDGLKFLPDVPYIRLFFWAATGKRLNLKHPITFEDKQQWLKLHNRKAEYTDLADKLKVREHIKQEIGDDYSIPLLGNWERFEDINFEQLPNQFVLKCNHDSGSTKVIRNKSSLSDHDMLELKSHFNHRLKENFFYAGREYPYKNIKPCILAEKYMFDDEQGEAGLNDYKFLCFHGEPKIVLIVTDRAISTCYDFYDMDFNHLNLIYGNQRQGEIHKPEFFDEMKSIAAKLSKDIPFVRIDLYEIGGKVYFGEYTFFDGGGFQWLKPDEWEYKIGSWIDLEQ